MKYLKFVLVIMLVSNLEFSTKAQCSRNTNAIEIFVVDSTVDIAKNRFENYLNANGFPTKEYYKINESKIEKEQEITNAYTLQIDEKPKFISSYQQMLGDTVTTQIVKTVSLMWGIYEASLKFIVNNENTEISIWVTGYATGNSFFGLANSRMQKGGKKTNWGQKDLFRKVYNLLDDYPGVEKTVYYTE